MIVVIIIIIVIVVIVPIVAHRRCLRTEAGTHSTIRARHLMGVVGNGHLDRVSLSGGRQILGDTDGETTNRRKQSDGFYPRSAE
jgi:hypothetical protein